jgi:hypothetical protein
MNHPGLPLENDRIHYNTSLRRERRLAGIQQACYHHAESHLGSSALVRHRLSMSLPNVSGFPTPSSGGALT